MVYANFLRNLLLCAFLTVNLAACKDLFHFGQSSHPVKTVKAKRYPAEAFVQNISLAKLALITDDSASLKSSLKIIESYSEQKNTKLVSQPVVVVEYSVRKNSARQKLVTPFTLSGERADFPYLQEMIAYLAKQNYTLHDIRVAMTKVYPVEVLRKGAKPDAMKAAVDQQLTQFSQYASSFAPLKDARLQLKLTKFFIGNRNREAAYISLENSRHLLASAAENPNSSPEAIALLSKDFDAQEAELHSAMPFTLMSF